MLKDKEMHCFDTFQHHLLICWRFKQDLKVALNFPIVSEALTPPTGRALVESTSNLKKKKEKATKKISLT